MDAIISLITSRNTIFAASLFVSLIVIIYILRNFVVAYKHTDKFEELFLRLREEIKFAIAPKFMELSIGVNELIDLAVEIWRIEQRISKSAASIPENHLKGLGNSIKKLKRYLEKYDVEIVDYKNQKFNEGLNLEILSVEKDSSLSQAIVKETVEPTILCKGQVVRKAKIILLTNK
ncbi:MAG: nucleotide exchange factor GrpE [Candidatus Peregrinibacteria bacterium]